jgi:hypothetical protein
MHGVIRMKHGEGEDTDRPEIDRRDLRVLLLNSVPQDKIRWGVKVERVQKQDDGTMSVCFTNGNVESGFRLVVGADGARSKARSLVSCMNLLLCLDEYLRLYRSRPTQQNTLASTTSPVMSHPKAHSTPPSNRWSEPGTI